MRIDANIQALSAFGVEQNVTANNVANVNTDEFQSSRVHLETGDEGYGVRIQDITRSTADGPLVPATIPGMNESGMMVGVPGYVEGSNTDIATEMTGMIRTQNAFSANVAAVRNWDQTTGYLMDMMI